VGGEGGVPVIQDFEWGRLLIRRNIEEIAYELTWDYQIQKPSVSGLQGRRGLLNREKKMYYPRNQRAQRYPKKKKTKEGELKKEEFSNHKKQNTLSG